MDNRKKNNKEKGDEGEDMAAHFLTDRGYRLLEKKWKYEKYEIDLIVETDTLIVFVEVKTRFSNTYGEPWEAVNKAKRKKICVSADQYIRQKNCEKDPRFDIISILKIGDSVTIEHLDEAFYPLV